MKKDREMASNGSRFKEEEKAGLVINSNGDCIINRIEGGYNQWKWGNNLVGDFNLQNKKYILEKKYMELVGFFKNFSL